MIRRLLVACANISGKQSYLTKILQRPLDNASICPVGITKWYSDSKNSNHNDERSRKLIKAEIMYMEEMGEHMPDVEDISAFDWTQLLRQTTGQRRNYYNYLFKKHQSMKNDENKKLIRNLMLEEHRSLAKEASGENQHIQYGLGKNTLFMNIYPRTLNRWRNHKIFRSLIHKDSQLIFDCGFEREMTPFEIRNTAKQLTFSFGLNRLHPHPFFFNFTNLQPDGMLHQALLRQMPTIENPTFPIRLFSDEFPANIEKERLVYLTPDSHTDLEFNHNDVYIISALVEKGAQKPFTLAKSKELGIRTARLPIDRFVKWRKSGKALTLDQVLRIMLELKLSGDFQKAFKHLPKRKIE